MTFRKGKGFKFATRYGKKFEETVLHKLVEANVPHKFEGVKLKYTYSAIYKPDILLENGIIVEIKTFLPYEEQRKLRAVKESHPELDIRLVFEKPDKILPNSKMSHGAWATKYGFIWSAMEVPTEWLKD